MVWANQNLTNMTLPFVIDGNVHKTQQSHSVDNKNFSTKLGKSSESHFYARSYKELVSSFLQSGSSREGWSRATFKHKILQSQQMNEWKQKQTKRIETTHHNLLLWPCKPDEQTSFLGMSANIYGSVKNWWLHFELQRLHVIERSKTKKAS